MQWGRRVWVSGGLLLLLCGAPLPALDEAVTIRFVNAIYSFPVDTWYWSGIGEAELDLQSDRNAVVRGQLQLKAFLFSSGYEIMPDLLPFLCSGANSAGQVCLDIPRANIRMRIKINDDTRIRLTFGRTRVTWGDGQLFNAADLIFGAIGDNPDFTRTNLRDETALLTALFIPFTNFVFLEALLLPPLSFLPNAPIKSITSGGRLSAKIGGVKSEFSYLYVGDTNRHNFATSIQGNLGVDFYLSASSAVSGDNIDQAQFVFDNLAISLGMFHTFDLENNMNISLRVESLWRPALAWEEQVSNTEQYAVLLYPELIVSFSGGALQIYIRSVFSPIDLSAQIVSGITWVPYSGLSLFLFPAVFVGEESDTYHIDQQGGISITVGAQYTFWI